MKQIFNLITTIIIFGFISCGNGQSEEVPSSKEEIPSSRVLNPYQMDATIAVNAKNLNEEVNKWMSAWKGKEVSVIVKGVFSGNYKKFKGSKGTLNLSTNFSNHVDYETVRKYISQEKPYIVITGKIQKVGSPGHLELIECSVKGSYSESTLPSGRKLNPFKLKIDEANNHEDIIASVKAWNNVAVMVTDFCQVPQTGNLIIFKSEDRKVTYVKASFDEKLKGDGKLKLYSIQGNIKIWGIGLGIGIALDTEDVNIYKCEFIEEKS